MLTNSTVEADGADTHVYVQRTDAVAVVVLNDAGRRNALHAELREDLINALHGVAADPSVRAVVLTGGRKCFSAGGDLSTMPPATMEEGVQRMNRLRELLTTLAGIDKPVVAAVNGPVAGAAVGLVCSCDVVVAGEESRFLLPFTRLGLMPDGGLIHLLAMRVGTARARKLLLEAAVIDVDHGQRIGLVDDVVADGDVLDTAVKQATQLGSRAPLAVAAVKQGVRESATTLEATLQFEVVRQPRLFSTDDFREGKQSFYEKRHPQFSGC